MSCQEAGKSGPALRIHARRWAGLLRRPIPPKRREANSAPSARGLHLGATALTARCFPTRWSRVMERETGLEPATLCLSLRWSGLGSARGLDRPLEFGQVGSSRVSCCTLAAHLGCRAVRLATSPTGSGGREPQAAAASPSPARNCIFPPREGCRTLRCSTPRLPNASDARFPRATGCERGKRSMSRSSQDPPQATSDARSDLFESGSCPDGMERNGVPGERQWSGREECCRTVPYHRRGRFLGDRQIPRRDVALAWAEGVPRVVPRVQQDCDRS